MKSIESVSELENSFLKKVQFYLQIDEIFISTLHVCHITTIE